jgi:hypothetical protein
MNWRALWPYVDTWWGYIVAVVSIATAIYLGPKSLFEAYDWYMYRFFDHRVESALEQSVTPETITSHGPVRWAVAVSVAGVVEENGYVGT